MGLLVMADAPNFEQAMMFANQANRYQHVAPTMWVGEQTLGGLGLGDQQQTADAVRAFGDAGAQIVSAIGQLKKNKKGGAPVAAPHPAMMNSPAPSGGFDTGSLTKWLMIGGVVIIGGIVLMKVLKKKKKDAPEHKEDGQ